MNSKFTILSRVKIPVDKLSQYSQQVEELTARSKAHETGTLSIEWYINEEQEIIVIDSYQDSDAFLAHVSNVGKLSMAMASMAPSSELLIFGSPNETVRQMLTPMKPKYFDSIAGFTR